jgi:histidinol-phosphate aminotransferase
MSTNFNRRDLFKVTGGAALGLAFTGANNSLAANNAIQDGPISLSGNENSYGPSPSAREALSDIQGDANRYGYSAQLKFVKALAKKEGVAAEQVILGAGSSEVLCATSLAFCGDDRDIIAAELGFGFVAGFTTNVGGSADYVPLDKEMRHDLDAMYKRIRPNTGLVYIVNPNNPTGTLVNGDQLRDFCSSVPEHVTVLIDEAYLEFTDNFDDLTMLDMVKQNKNVVIARTFSKIHGLAGMRIGYGIARPDIAAKITLHKMCKFQGPFAVAAASASSKDVEYQNFCRQRVKEGRTLIHNLCDEIGLSHTDAVGNFSFINPNMSNAEFKKRMLAHGFEAARSFPPRGDWARVTIGTTEEMALFAKALPKIIGA